MLTITDNPRNSYNLKCKYWTRRKDEEDFSDELIMKRVADGMFFAKEVSPETLSDETIGDSFLFDKTTLTIKSPNNLEKLKNDDIITIEDEKWLVVRAQCTISRSQNSLFLKRNKHSRYWYIELRK